MNVFFKIVEIREYLRAERKKSAIISLVPTMGALHQGHLSLVKIAKKNSDIVVLSNFVNPSQFGPGEDFEKYPRDLEGDNLLCEKEGVDAVFAPSAKEMYPVAQTVWVEETKLASVLCGKSRPGHFRGVCTVVAKLFNIIEPDIAVFGQKDYQQLKIIEKMVADLNIPVKIIPAPIVRESDGLAMSSRNRYLSPEERKNAVSIFGFLQFASEKISTGNFKTDEIKNSGILRISQAGAKIDYIEILNADNLQPFDESSPPERILVAVAAFFGATRLIDNIIIPPINH